VRRRPRKHFYHVTPLSNKDLVLKEGLRPTGKSIWVTSSIKAAVMAAEDLWKERPTRYWALLRIGTRKGARYYDDPEWTESEKDLGIEGVTGFYMLEGKPTKIVYVGSIDLQDKVLRYADGKTKSIRSYLAWPEASHTKESELQELEYLDWRQNLPQKENLLDEK